ncbi:ABC transporter ATP-binding protein [Paenacidovorax monticola]|uniref:ABC transporter ATP-binding protein n=1 Tax=Paenacidovorax monticola TaxID=1926868 RepID=A0A7H0HJP7_9BURK|nr:ABC transporter ATP-binding protein [Paenacidovorax monticola]QNP60763.1 ABC transporter ATP-binding protein [Paenacidovorax monticola]
MQETILALNAVSAAYGSIQALSNISLKVPKGAIVALLGSNGAGKTTTLNVISRLVRQTSGTITYQGTDTARLSSDELVRTGLVQVPEGRQVFRDMTVLENLELGAYLRRDRSHIGRDLERVFHIFPRLQERNRQLASTLSGGEQQMLAIGRAIMSQPSVMLFDEPSMGLSPLLVQHMFRVIQELNRDHGMTILLVEQNVKLALGISSYAYILENGEISLEGPASDLAEDEAVRKAYLGI